MKQDDLAREMRFNAFANKWDGRGETLIPLLSLCQRKITGITCPDALITVLLTYDYGYHACGWWKNSLYDECLHLSLSVCGHRHGKRFKMLTEPEKVSQAELTAWCVAMFSPLSPDAMKWLWTEHGKTRNKAVEHIRLFFSKITQQPILPQGQVYNLVPFSDGSSPEKIFR